MPKLQSIPGMNRVLETVPATLTNPFSKENGLALLRLAARWLHRGWKQLVAYARPKSTRLDRKIVEVLLVFQAVCFLIAAVKAPFGAFALPPEMALFLAVQAVWAILVMEAVRAERILVAIAFYLPLLAVTVVEALRFGGMVGAVMALEVAMSVIAVVVLFTLPRRFMRHSVTKGSA
ncbi:MAG: hypothetical protein AAF675_02880 [Pseudomonadota bacterium]